MGRFTCGRASEPGYKLLAMCDVPFRRGLWMRASPEAVELCAGREGDDAYVRLERDRPLDAETLHRLIEVMDYTRHALSIFVAELPNARATWNGGKTAVESYIHHLQTQHDFDDDRDDM